MTCPSGVSVYKQFSRNNCTIRVHCIPIYILDPNWLLGLLYMSLASLPLNHGSVTKSYLRPSSSVTLPGRWSADSWKLGAARKHCIYLEAGGNYVYPPGS